MLSLSRCHFNVTRSEFVKKQKLSVNEIYIFDSENPKSAAYVAVYYKILHSMFFFFSKAQEPLVGQGLLIIEASPSHSHTPHSVGLLWTSDRSVAETST
jgi:hypothetical protein